MIGRILRIFCLLLGLAGLGLTGWEYRNYDIGRSNAEDRLLSLSRSSVLKMALEINNDVSQIVDTTRLMANDFTEELIYGNLSENKIEQRIKLEAGKNPNIQAIGIAIEPEVLKAGQRLYAPYYVRDEQGNFTMVRLDQEFDYLQPKTPEGDWYGKLSSLGGAWTEPSKDVYSGELHLMYAMPFYRFDQLTLKEVPAGVVFAALAQNDFQKMVKALNLGDEGYAFIISGQGNYLAHPDLELINTAVSENATLINDPLLEDDAQKAVQQKIYLRDGTSGNRPCWYFYEPIPQAGWSLGVVLQKDPRSDVMNLQKYNLIRISLVLVASLILVSVFFFQLRQDSMLGLWLVSSFAALLIVGVITLIWYLEITRPTNPDATVALTNQAVLGQRLSEVDRTFAREGLPPPIRIPTGIFVESVAVDGRDVTLTGYLWQKYPQELAPETDVPVLVFSNSQDDSQTETFRYAEQGTVTVGYYFRVSQQQTFASTRYPLDQETISFQMQPARLDQQYLLMPDLDSYSTTNPSGMPGLKPGVLLSNWNILQSSFTYSDDKRNTDFGSSKAIKLHNLPALTFNLTLARFILPSMLSYGITAMVIAILMFSLVISKAESLRDVLTESFALFFVLVVAHVGLRGELAAQGVAYLETLFIILYGLILVGVLNGLLEFTNIKIPILSYQQGLVFKLLYWPILVGCFLFISLRLFYPNLLF